MSEFLSLNKKDINSALVYGFLMAALVMLSEIHSVGSIYRVDWAMVVDSGVMALVTTGISLIKNLITTEDGKFAGVVDVK